MTNPGAGDVPVTSEKPQKPRHPAAKARPAPRARAKDAGAREKNARPTHSTVGHGWIWVALVALALASGGSVAAIWFLEKAARDAQTANLEALVQSASPVQIAQQQDARTASLEARVVALEQKISKLPDLSSAKETEATTGLLAEKIEGLSGRISQLEKAPFAAGGAA
jgi:cell division protein FtsB